MASNALSARLWESWLSRSRRETGALAWRREPVLAYRHWIDECWDATRGVEQMALGDTQARALWLKVIRDSRHASRLIEHRSAALWADGAWRQLISMGVDPAREDPRFVDADFAAFQEWAGEYRAALDARRWIDAALREASLVSAMSQVDVHSIEWLDMPDRSLQQRRLLEACSAAGIDSSDVTTPLHSTQAQCAQAANASEELEQAVLWLVEQVDKSPQGRVALVVPALSSCRAFLRSLFLERGNREDESSIPVVDTGPASLSEVPAIGAALTAIELLGPEAPITTLSRWLRSPFFGHSANPDMSDAAQAEARLRSRVDCQRGFAAAWRHGGLGAELERLAPAAASRLRAAIDRGGLEERYRTPTAWARHWRSALSVMGWPGAAMGRAGADPGEQLDRVFDRLARLSAVLGEQSREECLNELRSLMQAANMGRFAERGVFLFEHVDDIGPGFDAIWACGFSSGQWPAPRPLNPLIPHALRVELGLPGATPADVLVRARRSFLRLLGLAPRVVVSWPAADNEGPLSPSPMLADLPAYAGSPSSLGRAAQGPAAARLRRIEMVEDVAPALVEDRIPGGTYALDQQSRCPIRAFCEQRLGARELDPFARGVTALMRGSIVHKAAELLMRPRLEDPSSMLDAAAVRAAAVSATARYFGAGRTLSERVFELEADRVGALLQALIRLDGAREPHCIVELESPHRIRLAGKVLELRTDRVDRANSGDLAIIDYKTGAASTGQSWFDARLAQVQLPVYCLCFDEPPGAVVECRLRAGEEAYQGLWADSNSFPGRSKRLPEGRTLSDQLAVWRRQLEGLVTEFAAGDVRILDEGIELAEGQYAPLTRIYEIPGFGTRSGEGQ